MRRIDVIATTMSGSISDWKKVERIIPLFKAYGYDNVRLCEVDSHSAAREAACVSLKDGNKIIISAGGSGTFRAVLEGCIDSGVEMSEIRLGFLRKGSADLIGKVLNMPDNIDRAIQVFAEAIAEDCHLAADILLAGCKSVSEKTRYFIGYSGAELFGRIPFYTENRHMKYYKGILGQLFGDLGPFMTGMTLALIERIAKSPFIHKKHWQIIADGRLATHGFYHAIVIVNGYLGPDLPFSDRPLGSGEFYLFGIRDMGILKLLGQVKHAKSGTILKDPERWGLESVTATNQIDLLPDTDDPFPVNIDGSTFVAEKCMTFKRAGIVSLISNCRI